MRAYLIVLIILFLGCSDSTRNKLLLKKTVWVNEGLKFDTVFAEGESGIYSVYGSGTLLFFDTNYIIKSFSNTFISHDDSVAWGEPGILLTIGRWKEDGINFIATNKLIERTFVVSSDTIGKVTVDRFALIGDTLIRNNNERFVPAGLLTAELRNFLNSDWSKLQKKDSL